jgi:hypothetical protein
MTPGLAVFKLAFQLSPILLCNGIATDIPGGVLPIIAITEASHFVLGLLSGTDTLAEKCQLKAIFMTLLIGKVARGIPPLGLEEAVWSMIPGELVAPTGLSTLPSLTDRTLLGANQMRSEEC